MKNTYFAFLLCLLSTAAQASMDYSHQPTSAHLLKAKIWNRANTLYEGTDLSSRWPVLRPFSEMEETAYVVLSGEDAYELADLRLAIAKNLPQNITLIIYVTHQSQVPALQREYLPYLGENRLKFLFTPTMGNPIWARDSLPFPVYLKSARALSGHTIGLVDSFYPQDFEPDASLAKALALPLIHTQQYFRGGNLLFDLDGNCFAEYASEVATLTNPEKFFTQFFGCASFTLLPWEGGIGDVDERLKFLAGKKVITDNLKYAAILRAKGYSVQMMPTTGAPFETYMNTLFVNGTIFVPQMGIPADADAIEAYKNLGFNAVGVYTKGMANLGRGNIHCVTMNYPRGTFTSSALGEEYVEFYLDKAESSSQRE